MPELQRRWGQAKPLLWLAFVVIPLIIVAGYRVQVLHIDGAAQVDRTTRLIPYTEIVSAQTITWTDGHREQPWFVSAGGYPWYPTGDRAIRINTGYRDTNMLIPTADADILNARVRRAKRVRPSRSALS